jgi:hypothetical protein
MRYVLAVSLLIAAAVVGARVGGAGKASMIARHARKPLYGRFVWVDPPVPALVMLAHVARRDVAYYAEVQEGGRRRIYLTRWERR